MAAQVFIAGMKRRCMNSLSFWIAGNANFAQLVDALHDQVRCRRDEAVKAEGRARDRMLDFGGHLRQVGEHGALVFRAVRLADVVHQLGQTAFGAAQPASDLGSNGQTEQASMR
jgi:hypothetical protein